MPEFDKSLLWFRRDLRTFEYAALHHALKQSRTVFCAFIFDGEILDPLRDGGRKADRRIEFIHASTIELDEALRQLGGALIVRHARASTEIPKLAAELGVDAVFANHDYKPQAILCDAQVAEALQAGGRKFRTFKDQVIFEKEEVLSQSDQPFSVFTPYKNAWLRTLQAQPNAEFDPLGLMPYEVEPYASRLARADASMPRVIPLLAEIGFEKTNLSEINIPTGMNGGQTLLEDFVLRIAQYGSIRDFSAIKERLYLSGNGPHLPTAMHNRISGFSTRSHSRKNSMRTANSSAVACPNQAS